MVRCKRDEKGELLLPSAGEELLPPPAGGPPPSKREVFWGGVRGDEQVSLRGAKGDRGDRKAPICNRRQGRRAWPTGEPGGVEKGNFSTGDGRGTPSTACGRSPSLEEGGLWGGVRRTRSARPRGLGGDFEFLPLKSPRNPITPIETSRVSTLHPGLYKGLQKGARRVIGGRDARELLPPPAGGPPPSRREVFGERCGGRASIVERGRRGLGATAKPLYTIGGKAGGLDRRTIR